MNQNKEKGLLELFGGLFYFISLLIKNVAPFIIVI